MRKKFSIHYPQDHPDPLLRGTKYKPPKNHMIVMTTGGVFLTIEENEYYMLTEPLHKLLPKYDVVWK